MNLNLSFLVLRFYSFSIFNKGMFIAAVRAVTITVVVSSICYMLQERKTDELEKNEAKKFDSKLIIQVAALFRHFIFISLCIFVYLVSYTKVIGHSFGTESHTHTNNLRHCLNWYASNKFISNDQSQKHVWNRRNRNKILHCFDADEIV